MDTNLEDLLSESESLIDLERKASEAGIEFSHSRDYTKWVRTEWRNNLEDLTVDLGDYADKELTLPTVVVEDEGIEYHIHGLAHGWPKILAPGWHARKRIKNVVNAAADSYDRPADGETYFYEERLHKMFDLKRSQELEDITGTGNLESYSAWKIVGKLALSIPVSLVSLVAFPLIFGTGNLIANPKISQETYLIKQSLKDEKSLAALADYQGHQHLPEPFNLEMRYLQSKNSRMQKWLSLMEIGGLATAQERSLWTAQALRRKSEGHEKVQSKKIW